MIGWRISLLISRLHSPRGRFAPGFSEIGNYFGEMWRDCAKNREHNGFLGKTSTLIATDEDCNNTMCWLSYWKDLDSLQAFANSPVHSKGVRWYLSTGLKSYPSIGILHETYAIPKGQWETISYNCRPFGIGKL
jgi:heme-degrading monooxygenase HmoA